MAGLLHGTSFAITLHALPYRLVGVNIIARYEWRQALRHYAAFVTNAADTIARHTRIIEARIAT